jgi:hypothetical protein
MDASDKAQALMDKALSTSSEEEARTCALTAVKLMRKAGITVGGGGIKSQVHIGQSAAVALRLISMQSRLDEADARALDLEHRLRAALAAVAAQKPKAAKAIKPAQPPAWNSGKSGPFSRGTIKSPGKRAAASETPRWITAKYDSVCSRCQARISAGTPIWWFGPRKGAICEECRQIERGSVPW